MFVLILLFQPGDHGRIGQRCRVAQGFPLAMSRRSLRMIFPERVFGKSAAKITSSGRAMAPIFLTTCSLSSATSV